MPFSIGPRCCWMDAREALRRYLEQRRDLGESELVLDSLSVEDALKLLGAAGSGPSRSTTPGPARTSNAPSVESGDWREAIRAAGGAPEARPARPEPRAREETDPMPKRTAPPVERAPAPRASAPPERDAVHVPSTQA